MALLVTCVHFHGELDLWVCGVCHCSQRGKGCQSMCPTIYYYISLQLYLYCKSSCILSFVRNLGTELVLSQKLCLCVQIGFSEMHFISNIRCIWFTSEYIRTTITLGRTIFPWLLLLLLSLSVGFEYNTFGYRFTGKCKGPGNIFDSIELNGHSSKLDLRCTIISRSLRTPPSSASGICARVSHSDIQMHWIQAQCITFLTAPIVVDCL